MSAGVSQKRSVPFGIPRTALSPNHIISQGKYNRWGIRIQVDVTTGILHTVHTNEGTKLAVANLRDPASKGGKCNSSLQIGQEWVGVQI